MKAPMLESLFNKVPETHAWVLFCEICEIL